MQVASDFVEETRSLYQLVKDLEPAELEAVTQFKGWSILDVISHLHVWNVAAFLSLTDPDEFANFYGKVSATIEQGGTLRDFESGYIGTLQGPAVVQMWNVFAEALGGAFSLTDPKQRVPWAGPSMSARSSISARLMETWAHGHEVFDLLGTQRNETDRIKNIAVLGVNTYGWTYACRGSKPLGPLPRITLTAPSGEVWEWGEADESASVTGSAQEFCQVVTQTRNIADVNLVVEGAAAVDWMSKAQCFAGAANDPPPAGTRFIQG